MQSSWKFEGPGEGRACCRFSISIVRISIASEAGVVAPRTMLCVAGDFVEIVAWIGLTQSKPYFFSHVGQARLYQEQRVHILTRLGCEIVPFVSERNRSGPRTSCLVADRDEPLHDIILYVIVAGEFRWLLRAPLSMVRSGVRGTFAGSSEIFVRPVVVPRDTLEIMQKIL